jgi:hypothetical protein
MRPTFAFTAALLLIACTSPSEKAQSWVGSSVASLMAQRGAPDFESGTGNGSRALTYQVRSGDGVIRCRYNFVADAGGTITAASDELPANTLSRAKVGRRFGASNSVLPAFLCTDLLTH